MVSLHVPLTAETRGMVNAQWLAEFAQPFFLLNTARGEVVNTEAVLDALTVVSSQVQRWMSSNSKSAAWMDWPSDRLHCSAC